MKEKELSEKCLKRNADAEQELFVRYSAMLRGVCIRYAVDRNEAEDMLQEGFIKIFGTIGSFKWQGEGSFVAWMRRVMVNNAINLYKKNKRLKLSHVESDDDFEILDEMSNEELHEDTYGYNAVLASGITQQQLLTILLSIPEMYRVVFNLSVIDGLRHKEISQMIGIDESSCRSRLLRAKNMLREALKNYMKQSVVSRQTDVNEKVSTI